MTVANERNELVSVREFDAPRALVHWAWTTPELLARWWGPEGFTNTFDVCDIRPGGEWRFVMHGPDGRDYPNRCVFVETTELSRVAIDHLSGHKFRLTGEFDDLGGGRTRVTFRQAFQSAAELEQLKAICMPANEQNLDRLGRVLDAERKG